MKKAKLISHICIFMVLCMLASMFMTSCNSGGSVVDLPTNRKAVTLTLYFLVEDSTTPEAIAAVEKALTEITEARYTTRIKLVALTRSEYEAEIARLYEVYDEDQIRIAEATSIAKSLEKASKDKAKIDKAAGITQASTKRPTDPPKTTELYTERIEFPKVAANQLDILLITSPAMFQELAENERLSAMDEELTTKAKVLKQYIHPSIMMAGMYSEKTLAIPTNKAIGTATYIAVNKRLAEKYELDLTKIKNYKDLTEYLEAVKSGEPDVALIESPFQPLKEFDKLFPEMPDFAFVSSAGSTLVYVPEQEPTEAPTKAPTEAPTDENGQLITEDPLTTTIPPSTIPVTTYLPKNTPAVTTLTPEAIRSVNKYTVPAYTNIIVLNQEYREKGLFETSAVPADKERAAFVAQGTLEDKLAWEAADKANGYEYEYILYGNPIAAKEDLQSAMYGISVSSKAPVSRTMEIITLLNTNSQFKNIFTYGIEKTHYIYNDNGRIERINDDYMINMDYTGNHFIADLMEGDNPNKWEIAKEHNLNVVNSVFLNFYFDRTKLTPAAEEAIPLINEFSERINKELLAGNIPDGYVDAVDYVSGYVSPEFDALGWVEFSAEVKAQTNPAAE